MPLKLHIDNRFCVLLVLALGLQLRQLLLANVITTADYLHAVIKTVATKTDLSSIYMIEMEQF